MRRPRGTGGSAVLAPAGAPRPKARPDRARVLLVMHADGYAEVFGNRDKVVVHVTNAIDVSLGAEVLGEDYLDATLPARYRALYLPRNLVASGHVRDCPTPEAEKQRRWEVDFVRTCRELRGQFGKEPTP